MRGSTPETWRRRLMVGAAMPTLLVLAACGKDDKPVVTAQPATTQAALVTTTTVAALMKTANNATLGNIMVDKDGKTLYMFDRDTTAGQSACTSDGCKSTWPALTLAAGASAPTGTVLGAPLGAIARADLPNAPMQVTWNSKPLYYYAADSAPGDTKGDGVGGTWHVIKAS